MDHAPEPHAPDSHGHAHPHTEGHGHDHHHGGGDYYLQQLLTIFICGAFGVAGLLLCLLPANALDENNQPLTKIGLLLTPSFHIWVLIGSALLLSVTLFRGVALWRAAGAGHSHSHDHHDHKPGEACDHPSHTHDHAHSHDHGDHSEEDHAHGNIYWRVVVLLLPVVLLVMGLPNSMVSATKVKGTTVGELADVADKGKVFEGSFETLATAALSPQSREGFTGMTTTVSGRYKKLNDTQFTLFYYKMTCCAADQVPLKATCVVKNASELAAFRDGQNVTVLGQIQFTQDPATGEYVTVLKVPEGGVKGR